MFQGILTHKINCKLLAIILHFGLYPLKHLLSYLSLHLHIFDQQVKQGWLKHDIQINCTNIRANKRGKRVQRSLNL